MRHFTLSPTVGPRWRPHQSVHPLDGSITLDGRTDMIRTLRTSWGTQAIDYSWANLDIIPRMFPSHLMGTFSTNRIYTVGRVDKVRDRMRLELAPKWVRFPPYLKRKNHHKFSPLRGDVSLQVYEHVGPSLCVVYTIVAPPIAMQVPGP